MVFNHTPIDQFSQIIIAVSSVLFILKGMAGLVQAVKDKAGMVKTRVTWSNIKTHLTKGKIIVFILIALLWGFSTVPIFIFYSTPESQVS